MLDFDPLEAGEHTLGEGRDRTVSAPWERGIKGGKTEPSTATVGDLVEALELARDRERHAVGVAEVLADWIRTEARHREGCPAPGETGQRRCWCGFDIVRQMASNRTNHGQDEE